MFLFFLRTAASWLRGQLSRSHGMGAFCRLLGAPGFLSHLTPFLSEVGGENPGPVGGQSELPNGPHETQPAKCMLVDVPRFRGSSPRKATPLEATEGPLSLLSLQAPPPWEKALKSSKEEEGEEVEEDGEGGEGGRRREDGGGEGERRRRRGEEGEKGREEKEEEVSFSRICCLCKA